LTRFFSFLIFWASGAERARRIQEAPALPGVS
jgi:hypothetical protein